MYRLKFLPHLGLYQIHSKKYGAFEGTLMAIKQQSCQMGVKPREFDIAIHEMMKMGHDVAEFGFNGGFVFTKPR